MRVLIADDEAPARKRMQHLLSELGSEYEIVAEASNGNQALEICSSRAIDIVLLDIRMPGKNGLRVAAELQASDHPPAIIFVTAYDAHALEAFEQNAVDYLLKPVRPERLSSALEKAQGLNRAQMLSIASLHDESADIDPPRRTHLCIRHRGQLLRIAVQDIIYFKSDQKYVSAHMQNESYLLDDTLKSLESEFSHLFIRIHRNALVNKHHFSGIDKTPAANPVAILADVDEKLDISRRHLPALKAWLSSGEVV